MKKTIALLIAVVVLAGNLVAQTAGSWKDSRHSIYLGGGLNWLIGDFDRVDGGSKTLSPKLLKETSFSFDLGYKYKLTERFSLRFSVLYSKLTGDDTKSKDDAHKHRGLIMKSNSFDFGANIDFYFIKEKEMADPTFWQRWSAYVFAGVGLMTYSPRWDGPTKGSVKNGDKLRDLHTETTDYNGVTMSVPLGLGLNCRIAKKVYVGLEWALRLTASDHIDDLHGDYNFTTQGAIDIAPQPLPAQGSMRGSGEHQDWYSTLLFHVGYKFGNGSNGSNGGGDIRFYNHPKYY